MPPQKISARNQSSTSLHVEWKEVHEDFKNGIILGYNITYTEYPNGLNQSKVIESGTTFQTVISGLLVWTEYRVSVAAYTKVGLGPAKQLNGTVRTEEGGKSIVNNLGMDLLCSKFLISMPLVFHDKDKRSKANIFIPMHTSILLFILLYLWIFVLLIELLQRTLDAVHDCGCLRILGPLEYNFLFHALSTSRHLIHTPIL